MKTGQSKFSAAAYGGENWSPRKASHRDEIGSHWGRCGIDTEWSRLQSVLLHPPGPELIESDDPESGGPGGELVSAVRLPGRISHGPQGDLISESVQVLAGVSRGARFPVLARLQRIPPTEIEVGDARHAE